MSTGKASQYYATKETREALEEIGGGNYSKGIRISAAYHERLVEIAKRAVSVVHPFPSEDTERYREEQELVEISRALLAEIEEAGK